MVAVIYIYGYAGNAHTGSGYSTDGTPANTRLINMPSGIAKDKYARRYYILRIAPEKQTESPKVRILK